MQWSQRGTSKFSLLKVINFISLISCEMRDLSQHSCIKMTLKFQQFPTGTRTWIDSPREKSWSHGFFSEHFYSLKCLAFLRWVVRGHKSVFSQMSSFKMTKCQRQSWIRSQGSWQVIVQHLKSVIFFPTRIYSSCLKLVGFWLVEIYEA